MVLQGAALRCQCIADSSILPSMSHPSESQEKLSFRPSPRPGHRHGHRRATKTVSAAGGCDAAVVGGVFPAVHVPHQGGLHGNVSIVARGCSRLELVPLCGLYRQARQHCYDMHSSCAALIKDFRHRHTCGCVYAYSSR